MVSYKPVPFKSVLGQRGLLPALPPSMPDPIFTGYTGISGTLETLLVVAATAAGAWVGIHTGLTEKKNQVLRTAGWVGGIGAALAGLLYLGARTGLNQVVGLPAVRVTPV